MIVSMKDKESKIVDTVSPNCALIDYDNYLLVKDIEHWINGLIQYENVTAGMVKMKDPKTGAKFLVQRIKDHEE